MHGANRLASNSLLEGLVFSRRIVAAVESDDRRAGRPSGGTADGAGVLAASAVPTVQEAMTEGVGVLRDRDRMDAAVKALRAAAVDGRPRVEDWQATNLVTVAAAIALAARIRQETRGSHWRDDFPERDDGHWSGQLETTMSGGSLETAFVPRGASR